jgi:tRNA A37 threonylcarbamoyladenosine synthetase subunit TsaC/SUA5/YrdC
MAERISLTNVNDEEFNEAVNTAVRYLVAGEVIVVAAEHGYVYLADAFDKDAVKAIHILRGNQTGTLTQVFIGDKKVLGGITTVLTSEQNNLLDNFWPGLLSVTLSRKFLTAVLSKSGPLAVSSVAISGKSAVLDLAMMPIYESDVGAIFDEGVLNAGPSSTWVDISENVITVVRVGAISLEQLRAKAPSISTVNL